MARTRETTSPATGHTSTATRARRERPVLPHAGGAVGAVVIDTAVSTMSANRGGRLGSPHVIGETTLLTFKEAMDFLRVSRSTVYRLMWSGQLRGHKVGSTWRFYRSDLLEAVASPVYDPAAKRDTHVPEGRD
jgi:excisionase family DNA binding protein